MNELMNELMKWIKFSAKFLMQLNNRSQNANDKIKDQKILENFAKEV